MVVLWRPHQPAMQTPHPMKKAWIQGILIIALFFATLFVLRQVDWMTLFRVEKITHSTEEKLGNILLDIFQATDKEHDEAIVVNALDSIVTRICKANGIDRSRIKLHVLANENVNAFALPDGHLVVYSGLIGEAASPEELAGVISHELAHIQMDHVMKKLITQVGIAALFSIATGGHGSETAANLAKTLSGTAFDRKLEREADLKAVDYLIKADISPLALADFLYKLGGKDEAITRYFTWISTHPDSKERAEYMLAHAKGRGETVRPVLHAGTWNVLKTVVE
jgi:predicted Zn-dependent protease